MWLLFLIRVSLLLVVVLGEVLRIEGEVEVFDCLLLLMYGSVVMFLVSR